jgi:N-acetylneuraminate synthase
MDYPIVIAEAGCNHKGEIEIAKQMIEIAATFAKADIIKFQKRNNRELLSEAVYNSPHPNPENSYGRTYGEHREKLEFNVAQHSELKNYCDGFGIQYSCSVWDLSSAKDIAGLSPKMIKIPSACNLNKELLDWLCLNYNCEIHVSFGMTTQKEEGMIVDLFINHKREKDLVLYSCTSGYPVSFEDVCLMEILRLKKKYSAIVKAIGFSGHHLGIAVDSAAIALGADFIERHYTLDRTWKGTDHAASLEPDGLRKLVRDCKAVKKAMTYKEEDIINIEKVQRNKLKGEQIKWR